MIRTPKFDNVIKEFIGYVGDRNPAIVDMFRLDLRRELRKAYRQGYKRLKNEINHPQDIFDNAG